MVQPQSIEFLWDMRVAISPESSLKRREEAIVWQVGHSRERDEAVLEWLVNYGDYSHQSLPNSYSVWRAIVLSVQLDVQSLLKFYLTHGQRFKSPVIYQQMQSVFFWKKDSVFLRNFIALPAPQRRLLFDQIVSNYSGGLHLALEICRLAECCDWQVLHRLRPWCAESDDDNQLQAHAWQWKQLHLTFQEIYESKTGTCA